MSFTRRSTLIGISIAGAPKSSSLQLAPGYPVEPQSRTSPPVEHLAAAVQDYIAPFPGSRARLLTSRLGQILSVQDFGAVGDGRTDDTQALQAAADAAAACGKPLFLPATAVGYLVTDTIQIRCRRIIGDASALDAKNPGTLIIFRPSSPSDLQPCFALQAGLYGGGEIEHLSVLGPVAYRREDMIDFVDPSRLPHYDAFASGVCAFAVYGQSQPTFRNVASRNVKVGLLLDSTNGHVSSHDCIWSGLFGVYCRLNSEDYFFTGGYISGVFAAILLGTVDHAGHAGGFCGSMLRVHMGFSPYGFYQARTLPFKGVPLTVCGRLDLVRFERIGEAIFQFLPESLTQNLAVDSFGMSWSPIYRGYPRPAPSGWYTNLPPDIISYDHQQQHMFRFGTLGRNVRFSWLGENGRLSRSHYNKRSRALARIEQLDCGESSDLSVLEHDIEIVGHIRPDSWTRTATGPILRRGDLLHDSAVNVAGNLLMMPEIITNWQRAGTGATDARAMSASLRDSANWSSPSLKSGTLPSSLLSELGHDPTVMTLMAGQGPTLFQLPFTPVPLDSAGQALYVNFWVLGTRVGVRVTLVSGATIYGQTAEATQRWTRVVGVDQVPPEPLSALVLEVPPGATCHIVGVMAAFGAMRPYNPRTLPRVRGGLALDDFPVAEAGSVPTEPAGFLSVEIDGIRRRIPYY